MLHQMNMTAGHRVLSRSMGLPARHMLARPFSKAHKRRVLVYYNPIRISWSQVYPFVYHGPSLGNRHDAECRFVPVNQLLSGQVDGTRSADVILVQPWFTATAQDLGEALDRIATANPNAQISFMDSYAHNDLRLARTVDPYITYYLKKSLFKDRSLYFKTFNGDTNLVDYYGKLYGLSHDPVDWEVPETILPKLRLTPNFLTAQHFIDQINLMNQPTQERRRLDVSARLGGTDEGGFYGAMRRHAQDVVTRIKGITTSPPGMLPFKSYMAEMRNARLCFSPFGYGELCWRDIEAIISGAVMIKPDMSHLETLPDLYEPGETYLPVRWDFADLEEVVEKALANEPNCARIAQKACDRTARYIREDRFVDDMKFLFA